MENAREYYMACWLAGIPPEEIMTPAGGRQELLRVYIRMSFVEKAVEKINQSTKGV